MTNTAADGTARVAEKEKVEKRRALGRGLESLLPGPRVVVGAGVRPAGTPVAAHECRLRRLRPGMIRGLTGSCSATT